MTETLLQRILFLLDRIESPTISHATAVGYSAEALAELVSNGILRNKFKAARIPRPARFGSGDDLIVRETSYGLFGVAEGDDFIEPLDLVEDDSWLYEISLPHLVDAIRGDSGIEGNGYRNDSGLIFVGQKPIAGIGIVDVYLSVPNTNEDSVMARCRRLTGIVSERRVALLTPCVLDLSGEDRRIFGRIVTISLMLVASEGHLKVNLDEAFVSVSNAGPGLAGPDLERLIQGKDWVNVATAARYLERTSDHVRRLVAGRYLVRLGRGRPLKISVQSLRVYKGTAETGSS